MNLTLKNVPDELHQRLVARAKYNRRSLNSEIIACLEAKTGFSPRDRDALLARLREIRRGLPDVAPELIDAGRRAGRE